MAKKPVKKKKIATAKKSLLSKVKKKAIKKPIKRKVKVAAIPKGYHSITPYLFVQNAEKAIQFYKMVFGAKEKMKMVNPNNKIMHAELKIGDTELMLADEHPEMGTNAPSAFGGSPIMIHLFVKNVDEVVKKAQSAKAKIIKPLENRFYGDRTAVLEDPFGHRWCVSTRIENVTPAKMKKRVAELFNK
jgi:PhnB protein